MMEQLLTAEDNRLKCSCCMGKINNKEKYFRDAKQGWRSSHTVNICSKCIIRLFVYLNPDETEVGNIKKEIILEKL